MSDFATGRDPKPKRTKTGRRAYPIPIDERFNAWDKEIKEMGLQGFFAETIRRHIKDVYGYDMTISQIRGRLTAMGVSTVAYRKGTGSYAQKSAARCRAHVLRMRDLQRDVSNYVRRLRSGEARKR